MAAANLTSPDDDDCSPVEMLAAALMDEMSMFCCLSDRQQFPLFKRWQLANKQNFTQNYVSINQEQISLLKHIGSVIFITAAIETSI
jgi:hypothetical protein